MGDVYGESADRPENTTAQHRWIHGEAQYEGWDTVAQGGGVCPEAAV